MRYSVEGLPPANVGAFMPLPTTSPTASSHGLVRIEGHPGDMVVPAPRPGAIPHNAMTATTQGSWVGPAYIKPSIYVVRQAPDAGGHTQEHFPGQLLSDHELPAPAANVQKPARPVQKGPVFLGQQQVSQPRVFQRFPQRSR